jgi:hypothetical protein
MSENMDMSCRKKCFSMRRSVAATQLASIGSMEVGTRFAELKAYLGRFLRRNYAKEF